MARDEVQYDNLPSDMILLDLTHSNLKQQHVEIRFYLSDTLETLRSRIHQKTGTSHAFQHLQIYGSNVCLLEIPPSYDENTQLGYFSLEHGMRVHCLDLDPHSGSKGGQYEDTSLVKRYVMSEEDYEKRKGTLRDWGRQQKEKDSTFTLQKHAKEHRELNEAKRQAKFGLELPSGFEYDENGNPQRVLVEEEKGSKKEETANTTNNNDDDDDDDTTGIEVGLRCEVQPGGRRGRVAFVGTVPEISSDGSWVGVVFDEPVGKMDGTASKSGKQYFQTPGKNYGGFVKPKNIKVGDYPERDIFDDEDSSDDEL